MEDRFVMPERIVGIEGNGGDGHDRTGLMGSL
jgi:hypothetical protein